MTVREFSKEYNIPVTTVYEASYSLGEQKDFKRSDLAAAVRVLVKKRLEKHRARVEKAERILSDLENV